MIQSTKKETAANRLIKEKSPYLLQHAYNPVDWYAWNSEAFSKAKAEDKPIFLSIGYATCHWCHVMERESFEDNEVAALLNRDFICIKVDREERPDIDSIYMAVCEAYTGQGGWPLTILMTPEAKPFFAATYLPKKSRGGLAGIMELLPAIATLWRDERGRAEAQGEQTARYLRNQAKKTLPSRAPEETMLHQAATSIAQSYDAQYGGFSPAPKFPMPHILLFLLRYAQQTGDAAAMEQAVATLTHMYRGGLFDHIGGGFARYSTDRRWLVPHFEKMLYDNALLSLAYLEGFHITAESVFRHAAEETLRYVLRELTDAEGGFYCGQDADSEGEEGKFYLFAPKELEAALGGDAKAFCKFYGITERGNFEDKSIPNLLHHPETPIPDDALRALKTRVFSMRKERIPPATDDKQLTAWNALMLQAFARASLLLEDDAYLNAAHRAQQSIEKRLTTPEGELFVRYRDGRADHVGLLVDYAFYGVALLGLYAATLDTALLIRAAFLAERMLHLFGDDAPGLFAYSKEGEQLLSRPKEVFDGALPSGNAAAGHLFSRLWRLTGELHWREAADRQLGFLAAHAVRAPMAHSFALLAIADTVYPEQMLLCVSRVQADWTKEARLAARTNNNILLLAKTPANATILETVAPFTMDYPYPEQGTAYYLCEGFACKAPVYDMNALETLLVKNTPDAP